LADQAGDVHAARFKVDGEEDEVADEAACYRAGLMMAIKAG
jgi:hypothetical protein